MNAAINTFVLVFASIFPIVNPPGSALVFLGLTSGATPEIRAVLARRIAMNSFALLVCSFLLGALILQFYGISIPILRVAGGLVVAVSGWKLLNEGSHKELEAPAGGATPTEPARPSLLSADPATDDRTRFHLRCHQHRLVGGYDYGPRTPVGICLGKPSCHRRYLPRDPALLRLCRSHPETSQPGGHRHRHSLVCVHTLLPWLADPLVRGK